MRLIQIHSAFIVRAPTLWSAPSWASTRGQSVFVWMATQEITVKVSTVHYKSLEVSFHGLVPGRVACPIKGLLDLRVILFSIAVFLKTYGCVLVKEIVKLSGPFHGHAITVRSWIIRHYFRD